MTILTKSIKQTVLVALNESKSYEMKDIHERYIIKDTIQTLFD